MGGRAGKGWGDATGFSKGGFWLTELLAQEPQTAAAAVFLGAYPFPDSASLTRSQAIALYKGKTPQLTQECMADAMTAASTPAIWLTGSRDECCKADYWQFFIARCRDRGVIFREFNMNHNDLFRFVGGFDLDGDALDFYDWMGKWIRYHADTGGAIRGAATPGSWGSC